MPHGKKKSGLFAGILLALLPKCPFCVMAYSSTVALCGQAETFTSTHTPSSSTTLLLSSLFCGITFVNMLLNYRNNRTKYAMLLALAGFLCILFSLSYGGGLALYYSGVTLVFWGVGLNGNLFFLFGKIREFFTKKQEKIVELQ